MEIISYLSGKKAQKKIKEIQKTIGQDTHKHGTHDVAGVWLHAHERISKLEQNNEHRTLSDNITSMTKMVAINLNKHAIKVSALLNAKKYRLTNLSFDDFSTDESIDFTKSTNIEHDAATGVIKATLTTSPSEVVLKPIAINNPNVFILSYQPSSIAVGIPGFFVSTDGGTTWIPIVPDEMRTIQSTSAVTEILLKAVLTNQQELDALAYSWA